MTEAFEVVWNGLTDPRPNRGECEVVVNEDFWKHNSYKHLCNSDEPWEDILPEELASLARTLASRRSKDLQESYFTDSNSQETQAILHRIAAALESAVKYTLANGPVLLYRHHVDSSTASSRFLGEKWQLVLAVGLIFAICTDRKSGIEKHNAVTSYFHDHTFQNPKRRYSLLIKNLVKAFCQVTHGRPCLPNEAHTVKPGQNTVGIREGQFATHVDFRNKWAWGFDENGVWSAYTALGDDKPPPSPRISFRPHPNTSQSKK